MDLDLKRIRYFLKVSETLNFSSAARHFRVSQPALTKAIQRLENDIGGALIRREGRNTHLTPLGSAMLDRFRSYDASASAVEQTARNLVHGEMPRLRLGIMCTIGPTPLAGFMASYQASAPNLEIVLHDTTLMELSDILMSGMVDIAFVGAARINAGRFRYQDLYREPMVAVCAPQHRFAHYQSISIEEVLRERFVDRLDCEFRDTFLLEAHNRDFEPMYVARSDKEDWAQGLVRAGVGVTIAPAYSIAPDLVKIPLSDMQVERTVSIAVPIGREDTEVIRAFLRAARAHPWTTPPEQSR